METLEKIEKIVSKWSETELTGYYYDGIFGSATIECNPYENQIWNVLSALRYVDNIKKIELKFAEDKDDDYDILEIEFIEIFRAEEHIGYYKEKEEKGKKHKNCVLNNDAKYPCKAYDECLARKGTNKPLPCMVNWVMGNTFDNMIKKEEEND